MVIISSAELRNNMKKYLDIAKTQKVVIQRGKTETFILTREEPLAEKDTELSQALTAEELLIGIEADIRNLFRKKHGQ